MENIDKHKYFRFDIEKYTGYRKIAEKSNLKYFQKIKCDGFNVMQYSQTSIKFNIDPQLIRRLKLKNISGNVKRNSRDFYILELIEKSEELNPNEPEEIRYGDCWTMYGGGDEYFYDYERESNKEKNKYQNKHYNNKVKNHRNKI